MAETMADYGLRPNPPYATGEQGMTKYHQPPAEPCLSQAGAFVRGFSVVLSVPALLLSSAGVGFGALARDGGFSLGHTLAITASMFALPNQVVLIDQLARNETVLAAAFAVALAALRLLPMTVTITPFLRAGRRRPLLATLAAHFVAVSPWVEAQRRLPAFPAETRLAGYLGLGIGFWSVMVAGTFAGYTLAGSVPPVVSATLLFLTPIYFLLSLLATSRARMDLIAIALGCLLAPLFYLVVPGFDLLATGLIGGTLAFLLRERRA
jgi:predicted branched-subunit amino acid permease